MKILKSIFIIILFVFEGLLSLVMTDMAIEKYQLGEPDYSIAVVIFMYGLALASLISLLRLMLGKEKIILSMIGMKIIVFFGALTVGLFEDYSVTADSDALSAGIAMFILTVVLIIAAFGIKYMITHSLDFSGKKALSELENMMFDGFDAVWYWDEVATEYLRYHYIQDATPLSDDLPYEVVDKIYIYACNRIAYLFVWLLKRGGLSDSFLSGVNMLTEELERIKYGQADPSEFLYYKMDGKFGKDDVELSYLLFLHEYYKGLGFGDVIREVSYMKDYDEIVLDSLNGGSDILYCFDFSWQKYHLFEKRLDERFEWYLRSCADDNAECEWL